MLWSSWHNHTGDDPRFSYCAEPALTPEVYRRALDEGPWQAFALTEHAFALALPPDQDPWPFQWFHHPERYWADRTFREDKTAHYLARLAQVVDGTWMFGGLEVEIDCHGALSMDAALWPYLDVVIGSIHYLPGPRETHHTEYPRQLEAMLRHPIDILGHPFRELSHAGPVPDELIDETLLRARAAGVAVEINAHMPFDRDADVLARAVALGVTVAFGIDTHHCHELALHAYFARVVATSGVEPSAIRFFHPKRNTASPPRGG